MGGQFVLGHRSSVTTLLGVGASYDNVSYSGRGGVGAVNYKRDEGFLRYTTQFLRTQINADDKLFAVFNSRQVTMFEMTKLISAHLS